MVILHDLQGGFFMKKVIIIGSGPAGISAALYLQRSGKTEVCVIAKGIGALDKADKIENYYGFAEPISGKTLHENGMAGARRLGVFFIEEEVVSLAYNDALQPVVYTDRNSYTADAVLLATGSSRQTVPVKGLKEHEGKGVSYCAVCDAFFFRGKDVCVLGSGEYAVHEAQVLQSTARSVTMLTNGQPLTADIPQGITVIEKPVACINGDTVVDGVTFTDGTSLPVQGIFMAIGIAGSTDLARKVGAEVENNRIKVNEKMETTLPGLYAAGDCTGGILQVYKAVYDGATAAVTILHHISAPRS